VSADAIHGNKSQTARQRALADFTAGKLRILVATDIAARGIDIDGITHVINYELPNVPESYVHRIGRTARAGADGVALSFCDVEEREYLRDIERLIRRSIPVVPDHPFKSTVAELRQKKPAQPQQQRGPRRHHRGRGSQRRFG
jgi:ATP-dependent RNA helicase RhlE